MIFNRDDPNTWPCFRPLIIAHDVGRSRDRSTAVIGGNSPFQPRLLGIRELEELAQGLYGSPRSSALATIDRRYNCNALIVADLSNDATYAEVLFETFGPRVIGIHIGPHGDGMNFERRPVKNASMLIYPIGRSYLLELFHAEFQADQVRFVDGAMSRRAYEQLNGLETEFRESGIVYSCPPGSRHIMCHAGVGGTASAFELVGRHRLIRAQAAQAKPNFRLGSLYMTIR
jgi:hypothetical protein